MQQRTGTRNSKPQGSTAQQVNALRLRIYQAKSGFMALGTETYMPFLDAQATREGKQLTTEEKVELRQVMNGRLSLADANHVAFIERALQSQQAA